jgi:Zn-dependent protease
MLPTRQGSLPLFRLGGIRVFLHWSWFLVAIYQIQARRQLYDSLTWNALEYVSLFVIVLMHEFGHALACRQVGGQADQIVLWPLGGVAYVNPPQRPGAVLWSIAAGPLVNVVLAPFLGMATLLAAYVWGWAEALPNVYHLLQFVCAMNFVMLVFNLMPIYPLDGGQILRAILWFFLGRARSLMVTVMVGFGGVALLGVAAIFIGQPLFWVMVVFILLSCWRGLMQARLLTTMAKLPRREGFRCPSCREAPLIGRLWICHKCRSKFDTFQTDATCPVCAEQFPVTLCPECGEARPMAEWRAAGAGRGT